MVRYWENHMPALMFSALFNVTMTMTMKNVLFDHKYMYVHNILNFRKCKYKSVWRLLLRQNSLSLS